MENFTICFKGSIVVTASSESLAVDMFLQNLPEGCEITDFSVVSPEASE